MNNSPNSLSPTWKTVMGLIGMFTFLNTVITGWVTFYSDIKTNDLLSSYEVNQLRSDVKGLETDMNKLDKAVSQNTELANTYSLEIRYMKQDIKSMSEKIDKIYDIIVKNRKK